MKKAQILFGAVLFTMVSLPATGQGVCTKIRVHTNAALQGAGFTLADLISRDSCAEILRAASEIHLGKTPMAGSPRIFEREQIRLLLLSLNAHNPRNRAELYVVEVPERITVYRAGARMSCQKLAEALTEIAKSHPLSEPWLTGASTQELDCGSVIYVPYSTQLELTKAFWNTATHTWEFSLRCSHASDCVPFLVRTRGSKADPPASAALHNVNLTISYDDLAPSRLITPAIQLRSESKNLDIVVRPGQTAKMLWDQAGIRMTLPVICLDQGSVGSSVRVRVKNGTRVLSAEVVSARVLRKLS